MKWIAALLPLIALVFLGYVAGAWTSYQDIPPASYLHNAFKAAQALRAQSSGYSNRYDPNLWQPVSHDFSGVGQHDTAASQYGYTLYTAGNLQGARLIDMDGQIAHEWQLPYFDVWPEPKHVAQLPREDLIAWRKARLFPNGDILTLFIAEGITPWGLGLVRLDKDSNLLWRSPIKAHHDFDIGPDGRIYVLTHEIRQEAIPGIGRVKTPFLDDLVAVLDADGNVLKEFSILAAFVDSPWAGFLRNLPPSDIGDYLHANAIELVTADIAAAHPYASEGDVLLSLRNTDTIALLSTETEKITWVKRGPWLRQHDADFLPNGNLMLFDNRGRMETGGVSRVLEFDPLTGGIEWQYHGSEANPFQSFLRSSQQRQPNGNTLITESDRSRLLEVTPSGAIAWEYVNPERGGPDNRYTPVLTWGQRYLPEQVPFLTPNN